MDGQLPNHPPPAIADLNHRLDALETELFDLWGHISAATFRFLELVAEFDRLEGWARHGVASCAQWLSWQCGIDKITAREKVRTARALEKLPKIGDAFSRGVISYSKVRAMTRIATPQTEDALLSIAEKGTAAHVERLVRKYRLVERLEEAQQANGLHVSRYVHYGYDEDGSVTIHAKLPPEVGALVRQALNAAVVALDKREDEHAPLETDSKVSAEAYRLEQRPADEREPVTVNNRWGAKYADALALLAQSFLHRRSDDAGSVADRHQVVVHIEQRLLADYPAEGPQRCELEEERTLAVETARRLACDCSAVGIVENDAGEPLSVGRKTRVIPPAIARALKSRDGGCRFPGCDRTRYTQRHHVKHWGNHGETKLSNLVTLCTFHHRLVHEGGFGLKVADDGAFVFTRPDGKRVEPHGNLGYFRGNVWMSLDPPTSGGDVPKTPLKPIRALIARNRAAGISIDARTARCRWTGDRIDFGLAVGHLIEVRNRQRAAEARAAEALAAEALVVRAAPA